MKRILLAAAFILGVTQAHAFDFSDTSASLTYGPTYKEPGIAQNKTNHGTDISKFTLTVTHFDVWQYGTNFVNIDTLFSNGHDPASPGNTGDPGAVEVYALYRGNLSGNAITGTKDFSFGPVKDVRLELGGDWNTKNTTFAPEKKLIVFGPNISFDTPGYLNLGLHLAHEWNNNGIVGKSVSFSPTFEMEITWLYPLGFTGLPLRIDGFFNVVAPKGKDGFGNQTATEILTQPRLVLDLGKLAMNKPNFLDIYVGYQFWYNKFGNDHNLPGNSGSVAETAFFGTTVHF
jgi:nucleoside-specific outer membrane channel protein Tsx